MTIVDRPKQDLQVRRTPGGGAVSSDYEAPALIELGSLAELTLVKTVGASDGATFQGIDIGSL